MKRSEMKMNDSVHLKHSDRTKKAGVSVNSAAIARNEGTGNRYAGGWCPVFWVENGGGKFSIHSSIDSIHFHVFI
jgi:hypothetical protein